MRTKLTMTAVAVTVAVVAAGCSSGSSGPGSTGSAAKAGGTLIIARNGEGTSMNNTSAAFENYSLYVFQQIGESLFTVSNDGQELKPWLATGYEVSPDGLSYTIKLRQDVKFSNGQPMTAKDVKFSIDADTATGDAGWGYVNAPIKEVAVVDDHTVRVDLKYKWAPIIAVLSMFSNAILPYNYGGKTAEEFYQAPIGTGPFMWESWKKGQSITLVKNPYYWQAGKPSLDKVEWRVVPDANTRKLQLQGGQVDVDTGPDWSSFDTLKNTTNVKAEAFPSTQIDYMMMNVQREPFQDPHIRLALSYAVDREALVKAVLFGHGLPANSLLSPGTPFYNKDNPAPTYDLTKAREELAKSSKPNGFSTTLLIRSGEATHAAVAQILQASFKEIGINLEIKQLDATANKQARMKTDYDLALSGWTMDMPDPDQWTSFALDPNGGAKSAFTHYDNPAVLAINKKAQVETDLTKRAELYKELQAKVALDAAMAYLYYSPYAYGVSAKVKNFSVTPLGNYHLEDVQKTE